LIPEAPIRILDPICGRGTTLLEGLIQGYQCTGVEIDKKQVEQLVQFFTRYLKTKKYKHRVEKRNVADHTGTLGQAYQFTMARTKESYKAGDVLSMKVIRGDTQQIPRLLRKETFHHIIGDLPYGVQHGSSSPSGSFTRNPSQLLEKSLPGWIQVLEPDGTLALSWNTFVLKRERIIDILQVPWADGIHPTSIRPVFTSC
jgi:tRNA G10  N-methylase Trm11